MKAMMKAKAGTSAQPEAGEDKFLKKKTWRGGARTMRQRGATRGDEAGDDVGI